MSTAKQSKSRVRRLSIDLLGFGAIIAAALTGWLPGPGGIPLLIIGLSLLATNHEWAATLLGHVKTNSGKLGDKIFGTNPALRIAIDIASILLISAAVIIIMNATNSILRTSSISLLCLGIILAVYNRNRLHRMRNKIRRK